MYRDIIERAIEQFAAAIAKIMQLRQAKQNDEAEQYIDLELLKLTGMYLNNFLTLPEKVSTDLISRKYSDQPEYLIHIADLLKEHGEMRLEKAQVSESLKAFHLALNLLLGVSRNEKFKDNAKLLKQIQLLKQRTGQGHTT